jgi:hypothetical protein
VERLRAVERRLREELTVRRPDTGEVGDTRRERYFALLLEMAGRDGAEEHVFDRLERLVLGEPSAE